MITVMTTVSPAWVLTEVIVVGATTSGVGDSAGFTGSVAYAGIDALIAAAMRYPAILLMFTLLLRAAYCFAAAGPFGGAALSAGLFNAGL